MATGAIRLDSTTTIILDEADQMMDLGFMPAIRRIMAKLPAKRQNVLLSATMPKQIRSLANDFLKNPKEISVTPTSRPIERIDQKVMHVDTNGKRGVLVGILKDASVERAIVFTRTKRGADKVSLFLESAGLNSAAIHGNKSQSQREKTMAAFRNGKVNILVATDIAARGIDIDDVSHVVNYELPNVPEAYVHRIGRTARAGKSGSAITLCDHTERGLLRDIERLIENSLERVHLAANDGPFDPIKVPSRAPERTAARPDFRDERSPRGRNRSNNNGGNKSGKPAHRGKAKPGHDKPNAGPNRMHG